VLAYYIRPLIEHEIDAKLTRLCRKKETIAKRFPKKQITALPSDLEQWRTQLLDEIRSIVGLNEAARNHINHNTLRGDYCKEIPLKTGHKKTRAYCHYHRRPVLHC
jgi:septation ring formation regulator EzrA